MKLVIIEFDPRDILSLKESSLYYNQLFIRPRSNMRVKLFQEILRNQKIVHNKLRYMNCLQQNGRLVHSTYNNKSFTNGEPSLIER